MKFVILLIRYIFPAIFVVLSCTSFALTSGDILSEIQKRVADERLLAETKSIILEGETITLSLERSAVFQKLEDMSYYNKRRQRAVPVVVGYILSQKEAITGASDPILDSAVEAYTLDKYARFVWAKNLEDEHRNEYHETALALLPEGARIPTPKASETYQSIMIDLSEQRIYAFEEGVLIGVSSVTTGKRGYPTARGDFQVVKKQTNRRLVSPFKDSSEYYNLHVDYWIQFYKGFGIHDACNSKSCWRKEFGGQDYLWRGSHGCVNTPYEFVAWLYEWVLPNTLVSVIS